MAHRPPGYSRQRRSGRTDSAYTRIDGKKIYLGPYGSAESRAKYNRILSRGQQDAAQPPVITEPTVNMLLVQFLEWGKRHYRDSSEFANYLGVARILRQEFGDTLARDFGPKALKRAREIMIQRGWVRKSINKQTVRTRAIFAWAVGEELIPPMNLAALQAVRGLRAGTSDAKEKAPINAVSDGDIDTTLPQLSELVGDIVRIHRLTGCRPSELLSMRPRLIRRDGEIWFYTPAHHKTEWLDKSRTIAIGPQAQAILQKYLFGEWCFQTEDGKPYRVDSYRRAITRACKRANIDPWTPSQLRHSTATAVRKEFGLDSAQVILGHSSARITEVYAERNEGLAAEVALRIG